MLFPTYVIELHWFVTLCIPSWDSPIWFFKKLLTLRLIPCVVKFYEFWQIYSVMYPPLQYYIEYFYCTKILPHTSPIQPFFLPSLRATIHLFTVFIVLHFSEFHISVITWYLAFSGWHLLLSNMYLRFIYFLAHFDSAFLLNHWVVFCCMDTTVCLFIYWRTAWLLPVFGNYK